ncbi:class I SAM-dependent methyltransferase [Limibaculum sp. FT325]|uniref:class I SAM-dependent methyltransferase n=1 Tax=Thermohalobaculum sediminis TaxID=2939436 RepID=UPI0020C0B7E5|nr:class I SAM-dependent methyltransferase [Limibaculum sediminis]MCL5775515.1 class I SAM-dependent methyltransferase [Limibaculum sediminis]
METGAKRNMRDVDQVHWWFVARRRILAAVLARVAGAAPADVVEVGCGAGGNLAMLARFGPLHASEIDPALRDEAIRRSGVEVRDGALPDGLPFAAGKFGLVAALDVVEHVEADAASVGAMAALLAPGGHLVVTVPAYRWLWSEHDVTHEHKRRYTIGEVEALMRRAGLEIARSTYFNTLLFPAIAAARLVGNALGRSGANDAALPPATVNAVLGAIFAAERWLLPWVSLPFGVSVLCIGRRPVREPRVT